MPSEQWLARLDALAEKLEKKPRFALARVLAHEVVFMRHAFLSAARFDAVEADLLQEVGRWSDIARTRARTERLRTLLDGKTKPRRRRRRKVSRRTR